MTLRVWRLLLPVLALAARPGAAQRPAEPPIAVDVRRRATTAQDARESHLVGVIARFYRQRDFTPAWTTDSGWNAAGIQMRAALAEAAGDGLAPDLYHVAWPVTGDAQAVGRADVALSLAALRFAAHVRVGVTPPGTAGRTTGGRDRRVWYDMPDGDSLLRAWTQSADAGVALRQVTGPNPMYTRLRDMLSRLRIVAEQGGWSTLSEGPTLRRGDRGPRVRELRRALLQRHDLPPGAADDDQFDTTLAQAVARFQQRHGLPPDSVAGAQTRRALNVSVNARAQQVVLGMERARWLPPVHGDRVVSVNLADFRVALTEHGVATFDAAAVIGTLARPTPLFADTITQVVFNPVWTIPPSIVASEILPQVRRDRTYLARHHMVRTGGGIQQQPGPWNALGQVAFVFPNAFNVYLHDTPSKALFAESVRAFSHGCIRVAQPRTLAALLLASTAWTAARIDSVIATGNRTVVTLPEPVPIHITYLTAFAATDGSLQFRDDVYGRDRRLQQTLDAERRRTLAALRER